MSFNMNTAAALTGLSRRQIGSWDRARVVKPSLKDTAGRRGSVRLYSFPDLVQLKVAKTLRDRGVSLQTTRAAVLYLKRHFPNGEGSMAGVRLITDGDTLFVLTKDGRKVLAALTKGTMVFVIALGKIVEDLKCEAESVCRERRNKVVVNRKAYEVVLHPDTEDGGFCVACPTLLGCDSQGDTEEEALEMIRDAIRGHLVVAAKKKKKRTVA